MRPVAGVRDRVGALLLGAFDLDVIGAGHDSVAAVADVKGMALAGQRMRPGNNVESRLGWLLAALDLEIRMEGASAQSPLLVLASIRESRDYSKRFIATRLGISRNAVDTKIYIAPKKAASNSGRGP